MLLLLGCVPGATPSVDSSSPDAQSDAATVQNDAGQVIPMDGSPSNDASTGADGPSSGDASNGNDGAIVPTGNGAFPFPQERRSPHCQYPAGLRSADVLLAFDKWKADLLTSDGAGGFLRVRRPDSPNAVNTTNSEGMAYGMLIAVYLDDQPLFDALWQYVLLHLNGNGLMNWEISSSGGVTGQGSGAATDGDEDMAFALVMADRQWGGRGSLTEDYITYGRRLITAIWDHEVDHQAGDVLLPGDSWGGSPPLNPSYFAPAFYRVFGAVTDNVAGWNRVVDSSYDVIERSLNATNQNETNGLVPAWCDANGTPRVPFSGGPTHFQLDSCRIPFRIGQDLCWFGEPRAKAYLAKISGFYTQIGAANITDGYELNGTPRPEYSMNGSQAAAFVGPAGVGAMSDPAFKTLLDESYARVATLELTAGTTYYQDSWMVLSLLMLTGNFNDLTALTP